MIYLYYYIFDYNIYINKILFAFSDYKLFVNINNNKIQESKVYINLV